MREVWKELDGPYGHYEVSNRGNVRNTLNGRSTALSRWIDTTGYKRVTLTAGDGRGVKHYVHRLVASAFILNPELKPCVNHINGNKLDCSVENLEWATYAENLQHAYDTKLRHPSRGEEHSKSILDITTAVNILHMRGSIDGESARKLYGVSESTVRAIWSGKNWTKAIQAADPTYQWRWFPSLNAHLVPGRRRHKEASGDV
ncbi:NUMOD4 domain-containing protein [Rhodococcus sp. HS-D2]|uniref:NUMOD4 domain-containing protein n=1 Tax=Rhodococcus sp. HS-D2 TaxID=1384636 RepID=UPI0009EF2CE0